MSKRSVVSPKIRATVRAKSVAALTLNEIFGDNRIRQVIADLKNMAASIETFKPTIKTIQRAADAMSSKAAWLQVPEARSANDSCKQWKAQHPSTGDLLNILQEQRKSFLASCPSQDRKTILAELKKTGKLTP